MKEIELPSGSVLKIGPIAFDAANDLKKAVMNEMKGIAIVQSRQLIDLYKDYLCSIFSSNVVENCLWECMKKCTYNHGAGDLKIDKSTFEPEKARADFSDVQVEVGMAALLPFGKPLWQQLQRMLSVGEGTIPR